MLTIFSLPKPFCGHIKTIQTNAIRTWQKLPGHPQVILFGNEPGIAEAARDLLVQHVPRIAINEFGTPLLDYTFKVAHDLAIHNILCFVNTDMILMPSFSRAVRAVYGEKNHFPKRKFLVVGRRWNADIRGELDLGFGWERRLTAHALEPHAGRRGSDYGIDFFAFPRKTFEHIPAFAVGRAYWDNWMIYDSRRRGIPVIDVSEVCIAIHQQHEYAHHPEGQRGVYEGIEAQRNLRLAGGIEHRYSLKDATKRLTAYRRQNE